MVAFHRAGDTRINVSPVEEAYFFKHYFEEDVFDELKRYYRSYDYRFEVPKSQFDAVRGVLEEHGNAPIVIEEIDPYAVVQRKYTEHPKVLFKGSVFHRSVGNFNVCNEGPGRGRAGGQSRSDTVANVEVNLAL